MVGMERWEVETEPEVTDWLASLPDGAFIAASGHIDLLAEYGNTLREPHTKALGGGLFELRFDLARRSWRISFYYAPARLIVLLTVFAKQRRNEAAEAHRARAAMTECRTHHSGQEGDDR